MFPSPHSTQTPAEKTQGESLAEHLLGRAQAVALAAQDLAVAARRSVLARDEVQLPRRHGHDEVRAEDAERAARAVEQVVVDGLLAYRVDEALAGDLVVARQGVDDVVAYLGRVVLGHHAVPHVLRPVGIDGADGWVGLFELQLVDGLGQVGAALLLQGRVEVVVERGRPAAALDGKQEADVVHGSLVGRSQLVDEDRVPELAQDLLVWAQVRERLCDELVDQHDGFAHVRDDQAVPLLRLLLEDQPENCRAELLMFIQSDVVSEKTRTRSGGIRHIPFRSRDHG